MGIKGERTESAEEEISRGVFGKTHRENKRGLLSTHPTRCMRIQSCSEVKNGASEGRGKNGRNWAREETGPPPQVPCNGNRIPPNKSHREGEIFCSSLLCPQCLPPNVWNCNSRNTFSGPENDYARHAADKPCGGVPEKGGEGMKKLTEPQHKKNRWM